MESDSDQEWILLLNERKDRDVTVKNVAIAGFKPQHWQHLMRVIVHWAYFFSFQVPH